MRGKPERRGTERGRAARAAPDPARAAAAAAVAAVLAEGASLADLAQPGGPLARPEAPADRARARRLAALTLHHLGRAEALLAPLLQRKPPPRLRALLCLATVEMHELGAPAHAAVDAAVRIAAAEERNPAAAGFVNAVLRKAAGLGAAWAALPPQRLPGWLRGRLLAAWGAAAVTAIEAAHARGAPLDLTPRDGDAAALAARLGGIALPTGSVRLAEGAQVSALPGYGEGAFWVQDAAAALPARLLAPRPGERVADLCAAPGGKTLQCAAAGARVWAVDASAARLARLSENLARTRLAAEIVAADALDWTPPAPPDAILIDAPCTATGTIRRHPDLPFRRGAAELKPLVALQAALIDRACALLPRGGRMVYAVCSLLPDEGEAQVRAALARHPGLAVDAAAARALPGVDPGWITREGGIRTRPDQWPDRGGLDGFYMALLRLP
jgi:16S rRNA (cytosine967-C5)-methyltransferase